MAEVPAPARRPLRFSSFELDLQSGELRKAGVLVGLQEQSLKVLVELLARPGDLVTREQLRQRLWPNGTFVDYEHGLNAVINRLREALGDSADSPRFIQTVPRRGYRFIASVEGGAETVAGGARRTDQRHSRSAGESVKPAAETDRSIDRDRRGGPDPHGRDGRGGRPASQNSCDRKPADADRAADETGRLREWRRRSRPTAIRSRLPGRARSSTIPTSTSRWWARRVSAP